MRLQATPPLRLRNYWLMAFDGVLFSCGIAMLDANTILPVAAASFGASDGLIALMPVMSLLGFAWAPLAIAHFTETRTRLKPTILVAGLAQRIIYLLTGLFLLFASAQYPLLALCAVAMTPFLSGSFGGLGSVAYQELMARTVPRNRFSSLVAIKGGLTAFAGIGIGFTVKAILEAYPGSKGFAVLHLCTFALISLSYILMLYFEEEPHHAVQHTSASSFGENLKGMFTIFQSNRTLRQILISRILALGIFVILPFLSLHSISVLGKNDSFVGTIVIFQMLGGICGNFFAGYVGDRFGPLIVFAMTKIGYLFLCASFAFANTEFVFCALFFLMGFTFGADMVANQALTLQLCPSDKRPSYIAFQAACVVPFLILFPKLGSFLRDSHYSFPTSATLASALIATSLGVILFSSLKTHIFSKETKIHF